MRLTVLGGFLGSGKTTWLRHQLHVRAFKDAFVIVNEAARTPVDDALLEQSSKLAVLAGGCACCEARGELIFLLRHICDERSRMSSGKNRTEEIILETSGLADPGPIVEAIRSDPVLVYHIVIREIIVTVDALYGLTQLRNEPLSRRQIETADRLVITKVDEVGQGALKRFLATLKQINPSAAIVGTVKGSETALPAFDDTQAEILPILSGEAGKPPIFPTPLVLDETVDWAGFSVWLSALLHARGDDVLRVKGVVRTPAGRLLLQGVRRTMQSPEILPEQLDREDNTIVVIGRGYRSKDLMKSLRRFVGAGRD
jgi:G3E family GTPase